MLEVWLESLAMHVSVGHRLPADLIFDIDNYKGSQSRSSSISSTPDGHSTPHIKTPDNELDDSTLDNPQNSIQMPTTDNSIKADIDKDHQSMTLTKQDLPDDSVEIDAKYAFIRDIPKSPHLSKDFSPTGERIRDSVRARRQQRMQQTRENLRKSQDCSKIVPADPTLGCDTTMQIEKSVSEPISLIAGPEADTDKVLHAVKDTLEKERGQLNMLTAPNRAPKIRPYGEKGFIINVNTEGALTLNNVKDLECCSDFDSSCDTSLNYIDVNLMPALEVNGNRPLEINLKIPIAVNSDSNRTLTKPRFMLNGGHRPITKNLFASKTPERCVAEPLKALSPQNGNHSTSPVIISKIRSKVTNPVGPPSIKRTLSSDSKTNGDANETTSPKTYKSALDELRSKLNQCRNKLESLESAGKQTLSNSRRSVKNYFKSEPVPIHGGDKLNANTDQIDRPSMYSRVTSTEREPAKSRLFRISDTPIFERRNVRSMFGGSLFRRSDSDENISTKCEFEKDPSIPQERTFSFKQRISPTSDPKPSYSFNTNTKAHSPTRAKKTLVVSTNINNNGKSAGPIVYTTTKYHIVREPSVIATTAPQRPSVALPAPNRTTARSQMRSEKQQNYANHIDSRQAAAKTPVSKPSSRVSLLSPERIHRLNAKLTESKNNTTTTARSAPTQTNGIHSQYVQRTHLKPTTNRTATHIHSTHIPATIHSNGRTTTGNQYQQNVVISKSNESPVRRTVSKFDRMQGVPKSSSTYLMD